MAYPDASTVRFMVRSLTANDVAVVAGATVVFNLYREDGTLAESENGSYDATYGWNATMTLPEISEDLDVERMVIQADVSYSGNVRTWTGVIEVVGS